MVYENVGNIPDDYEHKPRIVRPLMLVEEPGLFLKVYRMLQNGGNLVDGDYIQKTHEFLQREIINERISPEIGLGFVIRSEDTINVARWDRKCPIILKNNVYTFEADDLDLAIPEDIDKVGSFCMWELGIVNHERRAWGRYLKSSRNETDKAKYLDDLIKGKL